MLDLIDDQYIGYPPPAGERARIRAELLAEVPASERAEGLPDADFCRASGAVRARRVLRHLATPGRRRPPCRL
jgi:hypothetical protein